LFINIYYIYPGVHIFLCASNINENSALSVVISLSLFPVHFFLHFYFATEMKTIECQTKRAIAIDTSTRTHIRNFRQSKILRNISGKSGGKASAHTRRILNQNIYPLENGCGCVCMVFLGCVIIHWRLNGFLCLLHKYFCYYSR